MNAAHRLEALWQLAISRPVHGTGCGCASSVVFRLTPEMFELDVLDYVTAKESLEGHRAWNDAVAARESGRVGAFPSWLAAALDTALPVSRHDAVIGHVIVVLQGRIEHAAGRLQPASAKAPGWLAAPPPSAG